MKHLKVAIIDADLIARKRHRFPNLACMKLSAYWKEQGAEVELLTQYDGLQSYDKVFVSKVFTDTPVPDGITDLPQVEYGGTGFYFDAAPNLPDEIEHHFPDYHLYDDFVMDRIENAVAGMEDEEECAAARRKARKEFKFFLDYSIGFTTRGCFRKCGFCVNKKYDRVFKHSPLAEFCDPERPKICLLDDNIFGSPAWREILQELQATDKPFVFKQGLDERLLTDEKCGLLCSVKYDGDVIFAFDNVADYRQIEKKLQLIRKHSNKRFMFYVLCAFESQDAQDIENVFVRIELLIRYGCYPYIMRFEKYEQSEYRGMYVTLARWCNQPSMLKTKSFREYIGVTDGMGEKAPRRYMSEFEAKHPEIADRYFDMKWTDFN